MFGVMRLNFLSVVGPKSVKLAGAQLATRSSLTYRTDYRRLSCIIHHWLSHCSRAE